MPPSSSASLWLFTTTSLRGGGEGREPLTSQGQIKNGIVSDVW